MSKTGYPLQPTADLIAEIGRYGIIGALLKHGNALRFDLGTSWRRDWDNLGNAAYLALTRPGDTIALSQLEIAVYAITRNVTASKREKVTP